MAVSEDFLEFIQEQLSELDGIQTKKMFGGVGIYKDGLMFSLIGGGTFRLKVDKLSKSEAEDRGLQPPKKNGIPYWEVPADILEDKDEMTKWANKAYEAALRAKKK